MSSYFVFFPFDYWYSRSSVGDVDFNLFSLAADHNYIV